MESPAQIHRREVLLVPMSALGHSGEQKIPGTAMAWATALKKMSRICRFWSLWFDVTVEQGLIQLRTEPKRRNDDALHGDS